MDSGLLGDHIFVLFIFPLLYMIWLFDCDNLDLEFGLSKNLANYLG